MLSNTHVVASCYDLSLSVCDGQHGRCTYRRIEGTIKREIIIYYLNLSIDYLLSESIYLYYIYVIVLNSLLQKVSKSYEIY
jgi:hypothetical protein